MSFSFKIPKQDLDKLSKKIKNIGKVIDKDVAEEIGEAVVTEMKDSIAKGLSPIRGYGRFPAYKRGGDPDGYPGSVQDRFPSKAKRPVNLYLSGEFMESLKFVPITSGGGIYKARIFYEGTLSNEKETGHREGANGQPKRPTIPLVSQGETFSVSIQRKIIQIINNAIKKIIND